MDEGNICKKYGRLTVLELIKKYKRNYFVCKCDCGKVKDVKMSHLKSGKIRSCGCLNTEVLKSRKGQTSKMLKANNYSAKYRLFESYKRGAKERGYKFDLEMDFFIELTEKNCHYCGKEPFKTISGIRSRSKHVYNGVDRFENSIGYTKENCVPCCRQCNVAKSTFTRNEFFEWISRVSKHSKIPHETPSGPSVMFDIDDTIILWNTPEGMEGDEIKIDCEGIVSYRVPNKHNINLLKKFYESGHIVILWSGSGVRWCKAVAKALDIEGYVTGFQSKPTYYIDDIANPKEWIGKYGYFDINGKIVGHNIVHETKE